VCVRDMADAMQSISATSEFLFTVSWGGVSWEFWKVHRDESEYGMSGRYGADKVVCSVQCRCSVRCVQCVYYV